MSDRCRWAEDRSEPLPTGMAEEPIAASGILGSTVRFAFRREHDTAAAGTEE